MIDIQYQAKMGHDLKFKMAAMPIYMVKNIQMTSSPEPPGGFGLYFARSIWDTSLYKIAKPFRSGHKQALIGWGKVGENDAKFPIHDAFELER